MTYEEQDQLEEFEQFDQFEQSEPEYEDEFEQLRQKSMRTSASFEEVDDLSPSSSGVLSQFNPTQRLILAGLLLVDIVVIGIVLLVITGVITL